MKSLHTAATAAKQARWALIGSIFWLLSLQYFLVQVVVGMAYSGKYSLRFNTISDLGNTSCGLYRCTAVCSPRHLLMNISFVTLGVTMIAGAAALFLAFRRQRMVTLGFVGIALSGAGSILVGLFPENTVSALHVSGAGLVFLLGNVALLLFGAALQKPTWLRYYTLASGAIALIALVLFMGKWYLGLGIGGMERLTAYPQTVWMIVYGGYLLVARRQKERI